MERVIIRSARVEEWDDAMELAFRVFLKYEAPDYGKAGTDAFARFITDEMLKKLFIAGHFKLYLAFYEGEMIGLIAMRNTNHVSLLFVEGSHHHQKVGSQLVEYVRKNMEKEGIDFMTVNAAPYATEFYHKMGFVDQDGIKEEDGITYTPMRKKVAMHTIDGI